MVDSTCVMQSIVPSSIQQGGSVCVLGESVSFGRYMNQNLEWDKFSAFNQNRYLEEAQRLAKPGLVAQRKALFEAHFKKPVADKVPGLFKSGSFDTKNGVRVLSKENFYGEPCKDMGSAKSVSGLYTKNAKRRADALWCMNHTQTVALNESHLGEVNDFVNNVSIQLDDPSSDMAPGAYEDLEVDHIVADPKLSEKIDSINGLKTALNQSETVYVTTPVAIRLDKTAVQESMDKFVFSLTDSEPAFSSSNSSTSVKNHAVSLSSKVRSQVLLMKENNASENSKASGIGMVLRREVKTLNVSSDQNPSLLVSKKTPTVKELENVKYPVNTVSARGSKVHCDLRPAPTQLMQKMNMTSKSKSMVQKETSKWNAPALSQRTEVKIVSTSSAMSKTTSRAPANQVRSDATNMGKHTVPSSTSFGRKSSIQSQAKSQNQYGSKVIKMNSASTLSQNNLNKSLQKGIQMSARPSCNYVSVRRPTTAANFGSFRISALDARVSKESSNHKRDTSMQTSAARQLDNRGSIRPRTRLHEPSSGIKTTKRPPTTATATAFTPFRFRSDERAAIRKQKLEFKSSDEVENPPKIKKKRPEKQ